VRLAEEHEFLLAVTQALVQRVDLALEFQAAGFRHADLQTRLFLRLLKLPAGVAGSSAGQQCRSDKRGPLGPAATRAARRQHDLYA